MSAFFIFRYRVEGRFRLRCQVVHRIYQEAAVCLHLISFFGHTKSLTGRLFLLLRTDPKAYNNVSDGLMNDLNVSLAYSFPSCFLANPIVQRAAAYTKLAAMPEALKDAN